MALGDSMVDPGQLPENARKELYSLAYVSAVAASAGVQVEHLHFDYDSVDCQLVSKKPRRPQLGLQLKATATDCIQGDHLLFDLPIKNYVDLRDPERHVPTLLVVLHLPEEEDDWMRFSDQDLLLKNAAYYLNLVGFEESSNKKSVRVKIPLAQRFNRDSVNALLDYVGLNRRLP
jgi:hypothetical protein